MVLALYTVVQRAQARARDGARFKIYDVLFDDRTFAVQYLVVNVGRFALSRRVLVPAAALAGFDAAREEIALNISRAEVEQEADASEHPPVSDEKMIESFVFLSPIAPGVFPLPPSARTSAEPNLWSARDLIGYSLRSGEIIAGHVEDMVLDPAAWKIRSLVTSLRGERTRKILIEPAQVERIHWMGATVHVQATIAELDAAPDLILGPVEDAA